MTESLREKAIEGYLDRDDGVDWMGLMTYANSMFDVRDSIKPNLPAFKFDGEEARRLFNEHSAYLKVHPLIIDPKDFRDNCRLLQKRFIETGVINEPHQIEMLNALDWDKLSDETIELAGKDPSELFERASADLGIDAEDGESQSVLAGLFINIIRAYLKPVGVAMTDALTRLDEVAVRDKPLLCPTCGSVPTISSVSEVAGTQSNERKLFCSCCGTVWPFERVRCACCGNTNSNKLKYFYADEDPAHRLHACKECRGVMPTVFQNVLKGELDYDIELVAMGVVQNLYEDQIKGQDTED